MKYFAAWLMWQADCINYPNSSLCMCFEIKLFSNFHQKMKPISHPLDQGLTYIFLIHKKCGKNNISRFSQLTSHFN